MEAHAATTGTAKRRAKVKTKSNQPATPSRESFLRLKALWHALDELDQTDSEGEIEGMLECKDDLITKIMESPSDSPETLRDKLDLVDRELASDYGADRVRSMLAAISKDIAAMALR